MQWHEPAFSFVHIESRRSGGTAPLHMEVVREICRVMMVDLGEIKGCVGA